MTRTRSSDRYNPPVFWTNKNDSPPSHGIRVPLTDAQIGEAIAEYRQNPDAFKGVNPKALRVMGLNPDMTYGKTNAIKVNGQWTPNTVAVNNPEGAAGSSKDNS